MLRFDLFPTELAKKTKSSFQELRSCSNIHYLLLTLEIWENSLKSILTGAGF